MNIQFGYDFACFLSEEGIQDKVDVTLIFSPKNWIRKRKKWNPLKIYDLFFLQKKKREITNLVKSLGFSIQFIQNVNSPHFIKSIPNNTIGICTGFNQIFKKDLIGKLTNFVNIHPSLLPYYRGPTPIEWCIENKELYTGWTLHQINEEIDRGKILYQEIIDIKSKSVKEAKSEIIKSARVVLLDYLNSTIMNKSFQKKEVDAAGYYSKKIDYLSFH